jgi:hypothetical protein
MQCDDARSGRIAALLVLFVAACASEAGPVPLNWLGEPGQRSAASTASSIFWIDAEVDGTPGPRVIVDTGAPLSIFNPRAFTSGVHEGNGRVATLTIGGVTLWKAPVIGLSRELSYTPSGDLYGGILGFTAFGQFATSFNYRDREVTFGPGPTPNGVSTPAVLPFRLEGGGLTRSPEDSDASWIAPFPASRVLVAALIEGQPCTLLVDTGASWVGLDSSVFARITGDGRTVLSDDAVLEAGPTTASVTRLRSVSASGIEVSRPVAASGSGIDVLLTTMSAEVGRQVDGMLGAPFLQEFYVTLDYPRAQLQLSRYTSPTPIHDQYQRVGIELTTSVSGASFFYRVAKVFANSDAAAQQILPNEHLVAIDGEDLASLRPSDVDQLLLGVVGSTKMLQFEQRTLGVRVDELLPLP